MNAKAELIQEVAGLIAELQETTQAVDEAAAGYLGVNLTDLRCLALIGRAPMALGQLAAATGRTPAAITIAVDRLETAGLAERIPDANDRRRLLVRPSETAWRQIQVVWGPIGEGGTRLLAGYTSQQLQFLQSFLHEGIELQQQHTQRLQQLESNNTPSTGTVAGVSQGR
ncbi:MAG TPA: MarR family transcriptional regulator [Acidimicrobiia bacterium]|nr:MarR family transcriptional regulator [Acidimicrobiia bacterium]